MHIILASLCFILCILSVSASSGEEPSELYKGMIIIKQCLTRRYPGVCFKEKALDALNATIMSNEPINLGLLQIEKNADYKWNHTKRSDLPLDMRQRSLKLSNMLFDMIDRLFKSRTIKFNVDDDEPEDEFEGRKKGGGGGGGMGGGKKGGSTMMMAMCTTAGVWAGMMMGKMGMMAMTSMMMAKLALALSAIMLLKKLSAGGGGGKDDSKEVKIVYASSGGSDYGKGGGGGGGGGGWQRSLVQDPQTSPYRAYGPQDSYSGGCNCDSPNIVIRKELDQ